MVATRSSAPRCAIIQLEAVHEEIIPSIVHSLNSFGIVPDVYVNSRCRDERGDIFEVVNGLACTSHYFSIASKEDWIDLSNTLKSRSLDFVIFSTFQRDGIARWAKGLNLPIIGVAHNIKSFLNSPDVYDTLKSGAARILCLAPHVATYLRQRISISHIDQVGVLNPIYWGELTESQFSSAAGEERIAAVPGGVSFQTRAFSGLIDVLRDNSGPLRRRLRLRIVGGGGDRAKLEELVSTEGLGEFVEFAPLGVSGRVMYADYVEALRSATLMLPLLPLSFIPYREHKITSAAPTSTGFSLPCVLDRWTSQTYRIPSLECDASVAASLMRAATTPDAHLLRIREEIRDFRGSLLRNNADEMHRLASACLPTT